MPNDYFFQTDKIFYKHETTPEPQHNSYSMHTHNADELIYFLDGDATHVIENRKYKLKKGDLILIRPLRSHFIQIDSPARYERINILFEPSKHKIESVTLLPEDAEVINISNNSIAKDIFKKCNLYRKSCDDDTFLKIVSNLLSELFYNIYIFKEDFPQSIDTVSPLVSKALQYMNENLCTVSDIGEIANALFVSESYLFRTFKKELHQTPKKYITEKRLLMAQKMIAEGERPVSVSEKCGFGDYTAFYRNYTSFFGHTPSNEPET